MPDDQFTLPESWMRRGLAIAAAVWWRPRRFRYGRRPWWPCRRRRRRHRRARARRNGPLDRAYGHRAGVRFDPAVVVVGGRFTEPGDFVVDGVREALQRHCAPAVAAALTVVPAALGRDAEALGAIESMV